MDKIDRLLEYIHRTNPEMTRQKLIEKLGESDYSAKSIYFLAIQISLLVTCDIFSGYVVTK